MIAARAFDDVVEAIGARGAGQDRAAAFEQGSTLVVVLADGAGGTSSGAIASRAIVDAVASEHASTDGSDFLLAFDADPSRLGHGQATAIILSIASSGIRGTRVGDSLVWILDARDVHDIILDQVKKPLVGSGCAPVAVAAAPLGTRTLFNDAKRTDLVRAINGARLDAAGTALLKLVRLPNGGLQDVRERDPVLAL